ncbi:hypothetical protein [Actinoplanes subglobosus]|uniref:Uncharacterized protein n=1 Tax=Actinoplanes subglobosus TaxID=1547892 RepID=A0ABV8IZA6_9ACTN
MGRHAADRTTEAFERMVDPHLPALRAYVLRNTGGDEVTAGAIVEETLFRAAREPGRHPRLASGIRPWLMLAARDVLRDAERRAPARHRDRTTAPATRIVAAMRNLTPAHRELIVRTLYGGASLEDLAADRGVPVARIKSDLFLAMRAVRTGLDRHATR